VREGTGRLAATFRAYLEKVPCLKILSGKKEARLGEFTPNIVIKLSLSTGEQTIIVEIKTSGQPRFAQEAVNQLFRYRDESPGMYGVVLAPYISSHAASICERAGIGYADVAGNCRLVFGQAYIERSDWPNPAIVRRELRSLFTPKASRIMSVLLADPRRSWKVLGLAKEARVSLGQASNVKKLLEDREWIESSTKGLRLSHPDELLAAWVTAYSFDKNHTQDSSSPKQPSEVETKMKGICREMGVSCVVTGLSPMQLYLDLKRMKGRGEEAAEAILERVIKPTW
jgi:hypothetical protein